MSTLLTINVMNKTFSTQGFYFFQQPAVFSGGGQVYSDSLYSQVLGSYDQTGSILTFQANLQPYAFIQQASSPPQIGQSSGYAAAFRPIDLANAAGGPSNDATTASVQPLGLSPAQSVPGVQPGAFRITTPSYAPNETYNVGSAVQVNGGLAPSSFVMANPANNTDCQPVLKFYVQSGNYTPGSVMNFSQSSVNAAECDFTGGYSTMNVTLNADGTWSVQVIQ